MNSCWLLTVLFIFICCTDLLKAELRVLKGSTVELTCPYPATPTQKVRWSKGEKVYLLNDVINNQSLTADIYTRLFVSGNHNEGKYHLNIADVRESDEGSYTCSVSINIHSLDVIVIVGPTSIVFENLSSSDKLNGIEGQDMTIKCTAKGGQPDPDVKLVMLGSTVTSKRSTMKTFKPQRSADRATVTCQAGYEDIKYYPLNSTAFIHLKLKPVTLPFTPDTIVTTERTSFEVSCQSTNSRPAASMYWLLGEKGEIDITTNSTHKTVQDLLNDTFTVKSILKYSVDKIYNGNKLVCRSKNLAGQSETTLTLNVQYAPAVTVENKTFSNSELSRQIRSTLDANPAVSTCKWQQRSNYGEFIRDFKNGNQTLILPTVPEDTRYQDTGEYVCTTENSITGINGQLEQKGSGYIISYAPPVFTTDNSDNSTQYGKFGKSTEINVNVHSIPKYTRTSWYKGDKLLSSDKYVTKDEPAIVKDVFHDIEVHLDGYKVTLTISFLLKDDFTNYTLRLYYGNQYVEHEVTLESASAPEKPSNFTLISSGETSITVQWIPGYDGGQTQTFYIEYRVNGSSKWMIHEIKTSYQLDTENVYTLQGLIDKTSYELRMYAQNTFNQSQHTDIETTRTLMKANSTALGGMIGGVAGGLVVIVMLILIAFVLFKRKKGSGFPSKRTRSHSDSEVKEGLKDNVLYEGSDTEGLKVNILYQSAGPDSINQGPNAEYAEVSKPIKKPSKSSNDEYAEVQKQNDVYAEVDKKAQQKNVKKKKQKEKKKPPKSGKTKGGALNNNQNEEYSNSGIPMGNMSDGAYSNAENQSAGNKKNDQGLEYADLSFGSKIPKGKQPVIHGDENRTIYSEVDHTKKAPPPPQESEYEETDIRHGKK